MASTLNTRIVHSSSTETIGITYIREVTPIAISYGSWTGGPTTTLYKFRVYGTPSSGLNLSIDVYKNGSFVNTVTLPYSSTDAFTWYSSSATVIDGITMLGTMAKDVEYDDYEEFNIQTYNTLGNNDFKFGTSKVYKCIFIDGTGSHTVYQEQISEPIILGLDSKTQTQLAWEVENDDPDVTVNFWARLGTDSFVLKSSNIAPGSSGAPAFTGLSANTSYNMDVYSVDSVSGRKLNSEQNTDTQTTSPDYFWDFVDVHSEEEVGDINMQGDASTEAGAQADLTSSYPPNDETQGTVGVYYDGQEQWFIFDIQEV